MDPDQDINSDSSEEGSNSKACVPDDQRIEWEEDSDECMEDGGAAGPSVASTSASAGSSSSFPVSSSVLNSGGASQPEPGGSQPEPSQSQVHRPCYRDLPAPKRPHRQVLMSFKHTRDYLPAIPKQ